MKGSGSLDQEEIQEGDELTELAFWKNAEYLLRVGSEAVVHQRIILGLRNKIYRERAKERIKKWDLVFVKEKNCLREGKKQNPKLNKM